MRRRFMDKILIQAMRTGAWRRFTPAELEEFWEWEAEYVGEIPPPDPDGDLSGGHPDDWRRYIGRAPQRRVTR